MAGPGAAGHGEARTGMAGKVRQGWVRHVQAWQGVVHHGRHGPAGLGGTRQVKSRQA